LIIMMISGDYNTQITYLKNFIHGEIMGLIFGKREGLIYDVWYHSPEGRLIEKAIERICAALVGVNVGERLLDIGCGSGNHLLLFNRMGFDVSGIDASEYMIKKAKDRFGNSYILERAFAEDLPFDDNEFDITILINTLEFLDNPLAALREAGRVSRRLVFIGVANGMSLNGLYSKIRGYSGDPFLKKTRFYTSWQLKSLLSRAYGNMPVSWAYAKAQSLWQRQKTGVFDHVHKDTSHKTGHMSGRLNIRLDRKEIKEDKNPVSKERCRYRFGPFLGASVNIKYLVRTDNLPLKLRLEKADNPIIAISTGES